MSQYVIYRQREYPPHGRAWHLVDLGAGPSEGIHMTLCRNLVFRALDIDTAIPADEWQRRRGARYLCPLCDELGGSSVGARVS
jgi:hypothetical protein